MTKKIYFLNKDNTNRIDDSNKLKMVAFTHDNDLQ